MPVLQANNLHKRYPGRGRQPVLALDGLSIEAEAGSVLALLGPNGAGKSTTVKILTTLARPDSGQATVAGYNVLTQAELVRRSIGLVAQKSSADPMATGQENLVLAGRIHGLGRAEAHARARDLLARFELVEAGARVVRTYSGGMARKLDVALGLVHRPRVLFLDEPTTGLDPQARRQLWHEIERMTGEDGMTVLLTTHYLDEADQLAEHLAIVDAGRVVVSGRPEDLKDELRGDALTIEFTTAEQARSGRAVLARLPLQDVVVEASRVRARADIGPEAVPAALSVLESAGLAARSVTMSRPSLDDVYLRYVGRAYTAEAA